MSMKELPDRSTLLPTRENFFKDFLSAKGSTDKKEQETLAKEMGFWY